MRVWGNILVILAQFLSMPSILFSFSAISQRFIRAKSFRARRMTYCYSLEQMKCPDKQLTSGTPTERVWNLENLKSEADRIYNRTLKRFESFSCVGSTGESIPDRSRNNTMLNSLQQLREGLQQINSTSDEKFSALTLLAKSLNVSDTPLSHVKKSDNSTTTASKKKPNPLPPPPRLPYNTFTSSEGIDIRVGRSAADNDQLSIQPRYRAADEWWLHASGHAGSHVVIRCSEDSLPTTHKETLRDAAVLAAMHSKAGKSGGGGKVVVSYVRCRQVKKPHGVNTGTVQLHGEVRTITVDLKNEVKRLQRLEPTRNVSPSHGV